MRISVHRDVIKRGCSGGERSQRRIEGMSFIDLIEAAAGLPTCDDKSQLLERGEFALDRAHAGPHAAMEVA
ncbi:MAG: hypothetical protein IBX63_01370 [Coriobacteriia bacterium]|nr:hypothetical protein [Coriobacteriia bacterium]